MTADNPIADLLAAPFGPDWTIESLAEKVLDTIAAKSTDEAQEYILDANTLTDPQSRRILRPLLACLAMKASSETNNPVNLYGGNLAFKRRGAKGPVWIIARFENRPGSARVTFRLSTSSPKDSEGAATQGSVPTTEISQQ